MIINEDKTAVKESYLYNRNSLTDIMVSLRWNDRLDFTELCIT